MGRARPLIKKLHPCNFFISEFFTVQKTLAKAWKQRPPCRLKQKMATCYTPAIVYYLEKPSLRQHIIIH